jgi:hypothetical protein
VLADLDITGQVVINADDVTIRNSRITATEAGSSAFIVQIEGGSGVKIIDTEIRGKGEGEETAEAAVRGSALLERDHFYNCNECVQYDELPIRDTYMEITSMHAGAHVENVYGCSQKITVEHSTLFNAVEQTATVLGDTICNGNRGNQFTVKDSLLAGGGGVLEPQANENFSGAHTVVTGNRFARCLGAEYTANDGHVYCQGGPDANGYFPNGGSYYLSCCLGGPLRWEDNVWDDNSQPVCPDGSPGCGTPQPPPDPKTSTASAGASLLAALAGPAAPVRCVVPRLIGASMKAARRRARRAHCRIRIARQSRGMLRRPGSIIRQRPSAGRRAPRGTKIIVVISGWSRGGSKSARRDRFGDRGHQSSPGL